MNWTGKWHNPAYSGEGIDIAEYSDGKVIAHWYGYREERKQAWMVAVGDRVGNTATLKAWITEGPAGDHAEKEWGSIILAETNGDLLRVRYQAANGDYRTYELQPLYVSASQPEPETVIRIRNAQGHDTGVPCEGSAIKLPAEYTLEVLKGTLTITDTYATGPEENPRLWNPRLTGVKKGDTLTAGVELLDSALIRCTADAGAQPPGGNWTECLYGVHTKELGQIFRLSAHVRRP